jgi:formate/nitrite transporter
LCSSPIFRHEHNLTRGENAAAPGNSSKRDAETWRRAPLLTLLAYRLLRGHQVNDDNAPGHRTSDDQWDSGAQFIWPTKARSDIGSRLRFTRTKELMMSYLAPSEFVTKMVDAGESKIFMSTRDTIIRAYMAGAILALAAWFAVTINVNTGQPIIGALLFPVGFSMLYLLGFDLLTGVFVLAPLALLDKRPGVTLGGVLRNWGLVFLGNFGGALTVAFMMAFVTTFGFTQDPDKVGAAIGNIGEGRTLGYAAHGAAGMATLFIRGMLCNWMVSTGVVGAMISTTVPGKVIAMWMPILVFFYMVFEHSVVNMFLFPSGLMLHAKFSIMDYFIWNEIPTVLGNLVGGLAFTGLTLYTTHVLTKPKREVAAKAQPRAAA